MAGDPLPSFRYHSDPVATGSIEASDEICIVCDEARGWICTGPVYAVEEYIDEICPWCIADGSAAEQLDAEFTDVGGGVPDGVPSSVTQVLATSTPGFNGWQQEHWLYHCDDAADFVGRVGFAELQAHPDALEMLLHEHDWLGWPPEQSAAYVEGLHLDGDATAYLFRCLHCATHLAYSDRA